MLLELGRDDLCQGDSESLPSLVPPLSFPEDECKSDQASSRSSLVLEDPAPIAKQGLAFDWVDVPSSWSVSFLEGKLVVEACLRGAGAPDGLRGQSAGSGGRSRGVPVPEGVSLREGRPSSDPFRLCYAGLRRG